MIYRYTLSIPILRMAFLHLIWNLFEPRDLDLKKKKFFFFFFSRLILRLSGRNLTLSRRLQLKLIFFIYFSLKILIKAIFLSTKINV